MALISWRFLLLGDDLDDPNLWQLCVGKLPVGPNVWDILIYHDISILLKLRVDWYMVQRM